MKVKGTYVSVWDGGFCVESDMIADTESRTFEITDEAVNANVRVLDGEYVCLPVDKYGNFVEKSDSWKRIPAILACDAEDENGDHLEEYKEYFVYG